MGLGVRRLRVGQGAQRERLLVDRPQVPRDAEALEQVRQALVGLPRLVQREPDRPLDERLQPAERRLARRLEQGGGNLERLGVAALEDKALRAAGVRLVDVAAGVDRGERRRRVVQQLVRLGEAAVTRRQSPRLLVPSAAPIGKSDARLTRTMSRKPGSASSRRPWSERISATLFSCTAAQSGSPACSFASRLAR